MVFWGQSDGEIELLLVTLGLFYNMRLTNHNIKYYLTLRSGGPKWGPRWDPRWATPSTHDYFPFEFHQGLLYRDSPAGLVQ